MSCLLHLPLADLPPPEAHGQAVEGGGEGDRPVRRRRLRLERNRVPYALGWHGLLGLDGIQRPD
eukprot:155373-Pyramimonas_sp.AAC.1